MSEALRRGVADFARRELAGGLAERDARGRFFQAGWRLCAQKGLAGLTASRRFGGGGKRFSAAAAAAEGLASGCPDNGLALSFTAHLAGCVMPLERFGSAAAKRRFLPDLASGRSIGALAISEEDLGSDVYRLGAAARRSGRGYVLDARKVYVTNAAVAGAFIVFVRSGGKGPWALDAFVVSRWDAGVAVRPRSGMGLRTAGLGDVTLRACRLPADRRLGGRGAGAAVFQAAMEQERTLLAATLVGAMERELRACRAEARGRRIAGRRLDAIPTVIQRLADMKDRLEAARGLVRRAVARLDAGRRAPVEAASAKLFAGEARLASALDAVRLRGGRGYLGEGASSIDLRDALGGVLSTGTSDILRNFIAECLDPAG